MQIAQHYPNTQSHLIRLAHGSDLHQSIEAYCAENQIKMAWINALGALSQIELAFYNQHTHQYACQTFTGEFEILNATGNISLKNSKPFAHIHMTLSGEDFKAFGGHVMPLKTKVFACEVHLTALSGAPHFERDTLDPQTGLYLWQHCKIETQ
jgi:hypothetical protein